MLNFVLKRLTVTVPGLFDLKGFMFDYNLMLYWDCKQVFCGM